MTLADSFLLATPLSVDGYAGSAIQCSNSVLGMFDFSFTNGTHRDGTTNTYRNGVLENVAFASTVLSAIAGSNCDLVLESGTIDGHAGQALTDDNGDVSIVGLEVVDVGAEATSLDAVNLYVDDAAHTIALTDVTVFGPLFGSGVVVEATGLATLTVTLDAVTVTEAPGSGIEVKGATATLTSCVAAENDASGIALADGIYAVTGAAVNDNGQMGLRVDGGSAFVDGGTFIDNGIFGFYAQDASVDLTGSTVSDNVLTGVVLDTVAGSVTGNTITDNGDYGMTCLDADPDPCANTITGNATAALSGCDAACAIP